MSAFIRRVLGVALLALVVPALSGCELRALHVVIPDFESSAVEGVQVYRLDDATGQPIAQGELRFVGIQPQGDGEAVEYEVIAADGTRTTLLAELFRDPVDPDQVEVSLLYQPSSTGWYKVGTYNAFGASPLSSAQTYLAM